jgi:transcriptional regulator with XRE-family HTH domain
MSYRDENELRSLYVDEGLSQSKIADRYGVSQGTISKWIKKHDISRPLNDEEYLREMYVENGMSLSEIADEIGCWKGSVSKAMERLGIERRDQLTTPSIRTNTYGHEYISSQSNSVYIHRLLAVAEYGIERVKGNDVHHINGIAWDNRPDNIEVLCREEHNRRHLPERDNNGRFRN